MSSMTLPLGAVGTRISRGGTEADVVRRAVTGHPAAVEELYRRHAAGAWRLAAAVAVDPEQTVAAVAGGFVGAARSGGWSAKAGGWTWRADVLAGTYLAALEQLRERPLPTTAATPAVEAKSEM